jgi:mannan endo-1,4-beta-mannosidase
MDRASFFSHARLRRVLLTATAGIALCSGAAYATSDGLAISGNGYRIVYAGQPYSFTPTTKDPSGRKLVFSIANKPAWASFSTSTGRLWGTPGTANAPHWYSSIKISVTDGVSTAALLFGVSVKLPTTSNGPAVSLNATPATVSTGTASTISWSATNASTCTASGGWSGSKAVTGTWSTGALSASKTYTLTCNGASGTAPATKSITVSLQSTSTAGRVARPGYNTGHGLFVLNGKLYDSNGVEFRMRGVNLCHYDSTVHSGPGIARSNANTVRVGLWVSSVPTSTYASTVQTYISDKEVAIPTMFMVPGTKNVLSGDQSTADLASTVNNWVTNFPHYSPMQQHMIINVANEWGPRNSATWASAYENAIARLRAAGYSVPIMIDAGGWGQDTADLLTYAKQVFDSDPQKNVIFSFHVYEGLGTPWTAASLNSFALQLKALSASSGMVFVFGEFGPGRNIGPSPTLLTPQQVIGAAEAAGLGWISWAWDDNDLSGGASNNNSFSMTLNGPGMYTASSDLTTYGQQMVLSSYGLTRAVKASDF